MAYAVDASSNVLGGSVVHIPQAGNSPNVVKNRSSFPSTAVQRGDSHITYGLDVFTTDPTHVSWHEENEISYDKTNSVLNDHVATLIEAVGENMIYNWVHGLKLVNGSYVSDAIPTANIFPTTGDAAAVNGEDGQEGTRRAFSYKDVQSVQAKMNKAGVPKTGRYAMVESYMYQQFIDSLSANQMAAFQGAADLANGVVGRFAGFSFMERASVLAFDAAGALHLPGEALEEGSDLACLFWQMESVEKAAGDIKPFQDVDSPTYYGDIFSALVKMGGRCRRQDWKGVYAIKQYNTSPAAALSFVPTALAENLLAAGEAVNLIVTASGAFTVSIPEAATWLTSQISGNGVILTAAASGVAVRSAIVTLTLNADESKTQNITITQASGL